MSNPVCTACGMTLYTDQKRAGLECVNLGCLEYGKLVLEGKPTQAVKGATGADTIKARESVYGPFHVHAEAEQAMKAAMTSQPGWQKLNAVQKSSAEMIIHKLARILNESADYDDNWHDIAGYATLAEQDCIKRSSKTET